MARGDASTAQDDGFGQSLWDDVVFAVRFLRYRRRPICWRQPSADDRVRHGPGTLVDRFGDGLHAVADADGRSWVVTERDWFGWPDPPRFAVFAFEPNGSVWMAFDFNTWPHCWSTGTVADGSSLAAGNEARHTHDGHPRACPGDPGCGGGDIHRLGSGPADGEIPGTNSGMTT